MAKHLCPVCGKYEFESKNSFDYCKCCSWRDDGVQEAHPDEDCCANTMSLNQAKKMYKRGRIDMIRFNKRFSEFRNDGPTTKNMVNYRQMWSKDQWAFDEMTGMESRFDHNADEIDAAVEKLKSISKTADKASDRVKAKYLLRAFA